MKLYTVEKDGKEIVAVETKSGELAAVSEFGIHVKDMNELIGCWCITGKILKEGLESKTDVSALAGYRILAPIPSPKQDVICLGINYHDHKKEAVKGIDFEKKAETIYFSKRVSRANDPDGIIPTYDFVDSLDYETELGVIISKDTFHVSVDEAPEYIFGYTVINDVSGRNVQKRHQQWYLGKSLDGYTPIGPCIVTADEVGDPHDLFIRCSVNGETRQDSNTKYMITSVEEAISELSQGMTLQTGTIIATGTPAGVCMGMNPPVWLKSGDVVRCEIENIGVLQNTVG
ncbi:MAG: fumarylacetoacetate hydrolase family protein [Anaerolineaceae bacterium]|nr:fumarylacetoacetate hydrolase family protein [Anaerolineaceae bacterium]